MALQHLRSSTADKRPTPAAMSDGQLALNTNLVSPGLFFKDSNGDSVKIGPVHVGTTAPNVTPGAGGQAGNSKGEAWLDTTATNPILKVWNGSAFVAVQPVGTGTVVSTTDTGTVTSTMILDGTIVNADINASAAIAGTKISPDFGSQTIATTDVFSHALGAAATPSLTFTGDLNTGIFSPGADQVAVATNGVERVEFGTSEVVFNDDGANYDFRIEGDTNANLFFVDASAEAVGIGTTSPGSALEINAAAATSPFIAKINTSEVARIDSSGRLLVGTSTARDTIAVLASNGTPQFQIEGDTLSTAHALITRYAPNAFAGYFSFAKTRSSTLGGNEIVLDNDSLGQFRWLGDDGTEFKIAAQIEAFIDGTPGANDMPGRLVFSTTDDGASTPTEQMRITSAGRVGIGTTSPNAKLDIEGTGVNLLELKSPENCVARLTSSNTSLCVLQFGDPDDTYIGGLSYDNSTNSLAFVTNNSERARINSSGDLLIGQSTTTTPGSGNNTVGICLDDAGTGFFSRAASVGLRVNRTSDGALVAFASAGTEEGNISISGTTTSYNGAHLSRWSQLSNNAERIEILRGSVLSNIDEMCEWGEEDNEQLNRMKVSDVEGDKNVSGVFQDWDDDDDTYTDDFYCAMTGDFIIRIAEGVTVERGDLLMSAGDGTAKPQDDDIIRSKTIAKVTSTNVSCTYADGSYCVPCVLMAC